jgi:hypothetical protein
MKLIISQGIDRHICKLSIFPMTHFIKIKNRFIKSLMNDGKSNSMSLPKTICAGVAFSTLCTVERIAQAQLANICDQGS